MAAWCKINFVNNPLCYAHHLYLNDKEITNLVIPDGVWAISDYAFWGCSGLTSVFIPSSVNYIGDNAFIKCTNIKNITINCPEVGTCFKEKESLNTVTIGNSVKSIKADAFSGCLINDLYLDCEEIGTWFKGMSSLQNVILGNSVK